MLDWLPVAVNEVTQVIDQAVRPSTILIATINLAGLAVVWLGVRRYAVTKEHQRSERESLSADTQQLLDTMGDRYVQLDKLAHERIQTLAERLQNVTLQYSTALAENGELVSKLHAQRVERDLLARRLAHASREWQRCYEEHQDCGGPPVRPFMEGFNYARGDESE